jgi:hypothetical protein
MTCIGDLNCNASVDVDDLLTVLNNWGICPAGEAEQFGGNSQQQSEPTPEQILQLLESLPGVSDEIIDEIKELIGN